MVLTSIILWPLTLAAQDVKPVSKADLKSIEVKHFTNAPGVQLSQSFSTAFYSSFLGEIQRLNVAEQTVEEGTPVVDTDKPHTFIHHFWVQEGTFMKVQEGHQNGDKFEAGTAYIEIRFFQRNNHKQISLMKPCSVASTMNVLKMKVALNGSLQNDEQKVAEAAGVEAADAVRMFLYPEPNCPKGPKWYDFIP